jgi:osmotically-inducible protein OsmY
MNHNTLNFKAITFVPFLIAIILLGSVCQAETAGQYIDDTTIGTKVKAELLANDPASGADINVEIHNGSVQLAGILHTSEEKAAAIEAASGVDGVKKVLDALVVLPGSRSFGQTVDDTTIQAKVKTELAQLKGAGSLVSVNTEVKQGHVLLSGFIDSADLKKAAENAAKGIEGVVRVHDHLVVVTD